MLFCAQWYQTPLGKVFVVPDQWVLLKHKALACFIVEALRHRNMSVWEFFSAADNDNSGVLNASECYGALRWLQVPDLAEGDIADFLETADLDSDGIVDYREYTNYLTSGVEVTHAQEDSEDAQQGGGEKKLAVMKIDPFGAEELRRLLMARKQEELDRQREERLRRHVEKEQLDMRVFEDELDASRLRKGGGNPLVSCEALSGGGEGLETRVTDFKFSSNQNPIRLQASGKCVFVPLFLGTAVYRPIPPPKCRNNHKLSEWNYRWYNCDLCKARGISWYCSQYCYYHICQKCYDGDRRGIEMDRRDPAKNPTYIKCSNGCALTMQIPLAGGAHPDTKRFSISVELRLDKLPPKGHLQSLLRFTQPDVMQSRKILRTAVYLNGDGLVVAKPISTGGGTESCLARCRAMRWEVITVTVDPSAGCVRTYINGEECNLSEGLDSSELALQHKVVVLGGGKQAHARGGCVRRIVVHGDMLKPAAVFDVYVKLANENPMIGGRAIRIQSVYRGYLGRKRVKALTERIVDEV